VSMTEESTMWSAYFDETLAKDYSFLGFYEHRKRQPDFTSSFRKEEAEQDFSDHSARWPPTILSYLYCTLRLNDLSCGREPAQLRVGHRKYFRDVDMLWNQIERRHAEASGSVIQDTTEVFKNSIASVNSSIKNVNETMIKYNEELKGDRKRRNSEDYEENRISKKRQDKYIIPPPRPNSKPDSDTEDHEVVSDHEVQVSEKEISAGRTLTDPVVSWTLSTGKNVGEILSAYREKIPRTKAYLYPAYFGILDLSGEDVEVKDLFTDDEWNEMIKDFVNNVNLSDLDVKQEEPIYEIMDKITEKLKKEPSDLITEIESCVIEDNTKVNAIRRLIQTYAYNLQRLRLPMSETAFGSSFTSMMTKGVLTFDNIYHYEEGEIQSLASSVISNMKTKPTDRSLIGQKVDFRISQDQFEMLIGLRSGGLPSATKSKKWIDKVDLSVALRDVLINEGIENNGVKPDKFHNLFTLGVHTFNYNYNVYGLDWKTRGVWRLGLLQKVKLPSSIDNLLVIEKLIISLLRVEETLHRIRKIRHEILIDKARLYRTRRSSSCPMSYSICEHGRITRTRRAKE
ncbi:18166_t:CDS:10, partial [Funneliformis geosporum]